MGSNHLQIASYRGDKTIAEVTEEAVAAKKVEMPTLGFGIGNWHLVNGDEERARQMFEKVLKNPMWPAFGALGAEADLARMGERP